MSAGKWSGNASTSSSAHAKEGLLHTLPMRPHALVGREKDLEISQALILRGNVRLVTITGPPGVGKTRFAIELASTVASEFDDGVVFVDLAPVPDADLLAGQQTVRTPERVIQIAVGQAEAGPGGDTPLQVSSSGSTDLHALVMFVVDATKPFSSPCDVR